MWYLIFFDFVFIYDTLFSKLYLILKINNNVNNHHDHINNIHDNDITKGKLVSSFL